MPRDISPLKVQKLVSKNAISIQCAMPNFWIVLHVYNLLVNLSSCTFEAVLAFLRKFLVEICKCCCNVLVGSQLKIFKPLATQLKKSPTPIESVANPAAISSVNDTTQSHSSPRPSIGSATSGGDSAGGLTFKSDANLYVYCFATDAIICQAKSWAHDSSFRT